jgi:hypothetical protein
MGCCCKIVSEGCILTVSGLSRDGIQLDDIMNQLR